MNYIASLIRKRIKNKCINSGKVCPFWENENITTDLKFLDLKDNGNRANEYIKQCHEIEFIFRPVYLSKKAEVEIRCRPNDICSVVKCDYSNQDVAEQVLKEIQGE